MLSKSDFFTSALVVGPISSGFFNPGDEFRLRQNVFFTTTTRRHDVLLRTTRRKRRVFFEARSAKNVVSSCRRGEKNKQRSCAKVLSLELIALPSGFSIRPQSMPKHTPPSISARTPPAPHTSLPLPPIPPPANKNYAPAPTAPTWPNLPE